MTRSQPTRTRGLVTSAPLTPLMALFGLFSMGTALGLSEDDCEKPKIAVVNSSSELASCYSHLDLVAIALQRTSHQRTEVPVVVHDQNLHDPLAPVVKGRMSKTMTRSGRKSYERAFV